MLGERIGTSSPAAPSSISRVPARSSETDSPRTTKSAARALNERALSSARDAELLSDETALLAPLPLPGSESDRIVILVVVRRIQ